MILAERGKILKAEISIIIRTKDRELLLRRAIESIISQTFDKWLVIIVNNGGDSSKVEGVISDYKSDLHERYIIHNTDKPYKMEVATNIGIKLSSSKYVTLLDDDDTWEETFLDKCIKYLNENESFSGVVTRTAIINERIISDKIEKISQHNLNQGLKSVSYLKLLQKNLYTTNAFVYLKSAIEEVGYYNEEYPVLGDWEFNIRFARSKKIGVICENLAFYHKRVIISSDNSLYQNSIFKTHVYYDYCVRKKYLMDSLKNKELFVFIFIMVNIIIRHGKLRIKLLVSK